MIRPHYRDIRYDTIYRAITNHADSYIAKLARIATVRVMSCGVVVRALSDAVWLLHRPLLPLPSGTCRHLGW